MLKVGCFLSVRNKSTRLPRKAMKLLSGWPMMLFLAKRLEKVSSIDRLVICTSVDNGDDEIVDSAVKHGFNVFRGSRLDKLERYCRCCDYYDLDAAVIVDGDDPFCFPEGIDAIATAFKQGNAADCIYLTDLPVGAASTGVTAKALSKVLLIKDEEDTEVWGGYFIDNEYFKSAMISLPAQYHSPELRLTVDYPEDYEFSIAVMKELDNSLQFNSLDLLNLLESEEGRRLKNLNAGAQKKYEVNLDSARPVKFKESF